MKPKSVTLRVLGMIQATFCGRVKFVCIFLLLFCLGFNFSLFVFGRMDFYFFSFSFEQRCVVLGGFFCVFCFVGVGVFLHFVVADAAVDAATQTSPTDCTAA